MTRQPPKIRQLKITLNYITPPIWRRFQVRSDVKLTRLHEIIQIVMGWENYHLYAFDVGGIEYTDPEYIDDDMYELDHRDGSKVKLSDSLPEIGSKTLYRYDFGDNWEHTIELERILDPESAERYPLCIDGARACPRDDCGGVGGYEDLLDALADPEHEEHEDMKRWAGTDWDPEEFDCEAVNQRLPGRRVLVRADAGQ